MDRVPPDWPFAGVSRYVRCRPHRWHVQQIGAEEPEILMLHGAGASTHSWRGLAPLLAKHARLTMIDLPGHGATRPGTRSRMGLDPMAEDITALLAQEGIAPALIIGHSAGAALALRLSLDLPGQIPVVAVNGAFQMFDGVAGFLFPLFAKALSLNPLTARLFSAASTPRRTERMLAATGSQIDAEGLAQYHRLISDRHHVDGALAMMANWSLDRLVRDAGRLESSVLLLIGEGDTTVPPEVSRDMAERLPHATLRTFPNLGHLLHEEAPEAVAAEILPLLNR